MDSTPIVLAHEPPFRIGEAQVRPPTREIVFSGHESIIEPRVMQMLVALHRADGAVVSKDDLLQACWGGRIVGEDAINRVASRLRGVAEKDAGRQFRVDTITKVGYRLVPSDAAVSRQHAIRFGRRELVRAGGAAGAVALAGAAWLWLARDRLPGEAGQLFDEAQDALVDGSVEQTSHAVAKLRRAVQLAPDSGAAWGLLALAYERHGRLAPESERRELVARGIVAAKRSLALERRQPDALAALVLAMPEYRNWLAFERACRAALQDHPAHLELQVALRHVLAQVGRFNEGLEVLDRALERYPQSPRLHVDRIESLTILGRLDEAESAIDRAYSLWPRDYSVWFRRVYYLHGNGRNAEAAAMVEDRANRPVGIPDWKFDLTGLQVKSVGSGDRAKIREALDASEESARRGVGFMENAAIFAASVGDLDMAFRMLNALYFNREFPGNDARWSTEQAMFTGRERETSILFFPQLAGLRRDPRYRALTREIGLDEYWRLSDSRPEI